MKVNVQVDDAFKRRIKALPPDRQKSIATTLTKFMTEPALPSLKFRPLEARDDHFIINGRHGDRIILKRIDEATYRAVDVGLHDRVYQRMNR